ncbi:Plant basic secretory protein (BSP) family protein [Rhynchospora pubera]|uniref:Plant basic secretory protein (BSP) family protein n=1 Tax=Rhynchospora pubera TaxID=906938 RepID=A0AAV8HTJ7_9POAL|nr:Plant basic secretory protein (BSP) family protein [Rhynchospora pubera]
MDSETLLPSSSLPTTPSNPFTAPQLSTRGICVRAVTIVLLLAVSLWANYEASKGFDLTVNNASTNTLSGRRFDLMFVSNGKAAKMLLESSYAIEHILYPGNMYVKKPVRHVILELAGEKTTEMVQVKHSYKKEKSGEYLILIKPEILEEENVTMAMAAALYRAMAYVWLWDGTTTTQPNIVDAMVEYLMVQCGFDSMSSKNMNSSVGNLMMKCENLSDGFVARLNNEVHELWSERMVDETLNLEKLCLKHLQLASI